MDKKQDILTKAKKWSKRNKDNVPLARYFEQYCDLEKVSFNQFLSLVDGTNLFSIRYQDKRDINPAMDFEVFMNLMIDKVRKDNSEMSEERNYG